MLENLHKIVSAEFRKLDLPKPQKVGDLSNLSYVGQPPNFKPIASKDVQKAVKKRRLLCMKLHT